MVSGSSCRYIAEGMEEADFYEARFNLAALEKDCEDVCTPMVMIADADNVKEF